MTNKTIKNLGRLMVLSSVLSVSGLARAQEKTATWDELKRVATEQANRDRAERDAFVGGTGYADLGVKGLRDDAYYLTREAARQEILNGAMADLKSLDEPVEKSIPEQVRDFIGGIRPSVHTGNASLMIYDGYNKNNFMTLDMAFRPQMGTTNKFYELAYTMGSSYPYEQNIRGQFNVKFNKYGLKMGVVVTDLGMALADYNPVYPTFNIRRNNGLAVVELTPNQPAKLVKNKKEITALFTQLESATVDQGEMVKYRFRAYPADKVACQKKCPIKKDTQKTR